MSRRLADIAVEIHGHDFEQVIPTIEEGRAGQEGQTCRIVANTIKGDGCLVHGE